MDSGGSFLTDSVEVFDHVSPSVWVGWDGVPEDLEEAFLVGSLLCAGIG